ncbi:MAG: SDR family oxidoreductase [Acholeplasmataceae bacterium]|jgi:short-subunit dehydrogenase|nr:SDR family oxidoreductase [Acholeplasmataceae bacterium]
MKVIIVTGASSGIGLSVANRLGAEGHRVYGISRTKVHEKYIKGIQADVTDFEQLNQCYQDIFDIEGKVDVLINNAGFGISGSIEDTSLSDAEELMKVNFMGVFFSTKAALPLLRKSGGGKIINMSSVASRLAIPFQAFYSSSKAAINAFGEALHNEVSPFGISVCNVMPGDIKTGFTKNRRKNETEGQHYQKRVEKSIGVMEEDERNGMDSEFAAQVISKLVRRRHMPLYKTIGFKYKLFVFLHKILPATFTNRLVGMIYGFKKVK